MRSISFLRRGSGVEFGSAPYTGMLLAIVLVGVLAVSLMTGRDYGSYVENRLVSLLPGEEAAFRPAAKAWDTRLPSAGRELILWSSSPIFGRGFGIGDLDDLATGYHGYHHNVWTSTLSETGIIGLAGMLVVVFGTIVIGQRLAKDRGGRPYVLTGALAAITGVAALLAGTMTMSINTQRQALSLGLIFGLALRTRVLQLAHRQHSGESKDSGVAALEGASIRMDSPSARTYEY